jgi:hypothetical protein
MPKDRKRGAIIEFEARVPPEIWQASETYWIETTKYYGAGPSAHIQGKSLRVDGGLSECRGSRTVYGHVAEGPRGSQSGGSAHECANRLGLRLFAGARRLIGGSHGKSQAQFCYAGYPTTTVKA